MGERPVGPVSAGAPAHVAELVGIGHAALDEIVDAAHDVFKALTEIIAGDLAAELRSVAA